MTKDELEEIKSACCVIVGDILGHFVDRHVFSEREKELLEKFAANVQDAVRSITPIEEIS